MSEDLFDLESVDISALPSTSLQGELEIPTEDPYLSISSSHLSQFLQLASKFSYKSGLDPVSKSVSISVSPSKDSVICRATNFDSYLEVELPLNKPSNTPIDHALIFYTSTLMKLIKLSDDFITFSQKDSTQLPAILVMGEWVPVEPVTLDPNLFINQDPVVNEQGVEPPPLKDLISIASSGVSPKNRMISVTKTGIVLTHLFSVIQLPYTSPITYSLTSTEAGIVKALTANAQSLTISLTESDLPRLVFKTPLAKLCLIHRVPEQVPESDLPRFSVSFNVSALTQILRLSENLPSSTGNIQFKYDNGLFITFLSKLAQTQFPIQTECLGNVVPLNSSTIQSKVLAMMFKPLVSEGLSLTWNNTTLYLTSSSGKAQILFESEN